uniref:Uncharacterized protein n=1 Tax=Acrobeloides nanus TaxID=290746 RepID=A0A914DL16_9BILA
MAPYPQVVAYENKIVYVLTEDQEGTAEFRILDLDGNIEHEQFIEGKIQSLAINNNGEIFMTKQPAKGAEEFLIYKTTMDCPLGWEELVSSDDLCFQSLCAFDSKTLVVATCSAPLNMYSKQAIKLIDSNTGKILHSFSSMGKDEGQIFFPRSIQRYKDDILMMDKTGKFQRFDLNGKLLEVSARIDAYIANGFIINGDEALIVCSGIVLDEEGHSLCDDWLELIKLDGSWWPRN